MEKVSPKNDTRKTLAIVLIAFGAFWLLKKSGLFFLPPFVALKSLTAPLYSIVHVLFSWPFILILVGLILMAGRRSSGIVLLVIGGIFLIPKLFLFTGLALLFFPLLFIVLGIALLARLL